ncbi:hypothetical protein HY214_03555 [Candidatus Roizmanbacteria bacterium]|nr:hypothetical protein [Candidatus Roizmanbacteria bacterium]
MLTTFLLLLAFSLLSAVWSMGDWDVPDEIKRIINMRKLRGTIVFFKNKVKHYSSASSSISSDR